MTGGAHFFARFAYPPNSLGYCGPHDTELLAEMVGDRTTPFDEFRHAITAFAGAWPYLELIGAAAQRDPLSVDVVEAYWIGNRLLDEVDLLGWGNSLDDRFRSRAGWEWDRIVAGLNDGGVPHHSFHVLCVYPWVGLLRSGIVERSLEVIDRCRIRSGLVLGQLNGQLLVESRPLKWNGQSLYLGEPAVELVYGSIDPNVSAVEGQTVALHWDYMCQPIDATQAAELAERERRHLAIANRSRLADRFEG